MLAMRLLRASRGRAYDADDWGRDYARLDPDFPDAHHNLGMLLLALNQPNEAITQLREVLRLKPDDAQIREVLRRMESQR
jgi:predicted Zn-dependent protease